MKTLYWLVGCAAFMAASMAIAAPDDGSGPICLPGMCSPGGDEIIIIIGDAPYECEENWSKGVMVNLDGDCECMESNGWAPGPEGPNGEITCEWKGPGNPLEPDPNVPPDGGGGGTPQSCSSKCQTKLTNCEKAAVKAQKDCIINSDHWALEACEGFGSTNIDGTRLGSCDRPPGRPSNPGHANPTPLHCCIWGSTANGEFKHPNGGWLFGIDGTTKQYNWGFSIPGVSLSKVSSVTYSSADGLRSGCIKVGTHLRSTCGDEHGECLKECSGASPGAGGIGGIGGGGKLPDPFAPGQGTVLP